MRSLTLLLALCWSCSSPPPAKQAQEVPLPPPPPPASPAPPAVVAKPPPRDPCLLGPNEVSNDETPAIAGTTGSTKTGEWLEARGVSKAAFRGFIKSRDPRNLEDFDVDNLYDGECLTLTVGEKKEESLVCTTAVRTSIMRESAIAFVVRNKRIVPVLEAGYSLPAMDWPDSSWLDLQVAFSAGGLEADIHDRAKPGAVLVLAPSECHKSVAENSAPPPESTMGGDHIPLSGCAEALPKLDQLIKENGSTGPFVVEFRGDRDFAIKSCKARGHYMWKNDRFVRATP